MRKVLQKLISVLLLILVCLFPLETAATASSKSINQAANNKIHNTEGAVQAVPVPNSLVLDQTLLQVEKGRMSTIQAIFVQENGEQLILPSQDVNWSTSDSSVASVFQGKVSGVRLGEARITASYQDKQSTVTISVVKPTSSIKSGPKFNFFELVSNMGQFDSLLSNYSLNELKVAVPEQAFKSGTIGTNNFTTNIEVATSSKVRKVTVRSNGSSFDAIHTDANNFERSIPGLRVGDEITIRAYDGSGNELQMLVFRLKDETISFQEDYGLLTKKEYTLKELTEDKELFNELLRLYPLSDLQITGPLRYLNTITADYTTWFTSFKIKTFAPAEQIMIEVNGKEYEAKYMSDCVYSREVTGLKTGDQATIKVFDEFGSLIEKKLVSIED